MSNVEQAIGLSHSLTMHLHRIGQQLTYRSMVRLNDLLGPDFVCERTELDRANPSAKPVLVLLSGTGITLAEKSLRVDLQDSALLQTVVPHLRDHAAAAQAMANIDLGTRLAVGGTGEIRDETVGVSLTESAQYIGRRGSALTDIGPLLVEIKRQADEMVQGLPAAWRDGLKEALHQQGSRPSFDVGRYLDALVVKDPPTLFGVPEDLQLGQAGLRQIFKLVRLTQQLDGRLSDPELFPAKPSGEEEESDFEMR